MKIMNQAIEPKWSEKFILIGDFSLYLCVDSENIRATCKAAWRICRARIICDIQLSLSSVL
jgi:hypothetical protein